MSAHCSIRSHSPLKSVFGKIGDTYQAYCNTYKTHAMATHHGGIGHPLDRDIHLNRGNPKNAETEIENTHEFDATVTLHDTEETGHPKGPEYNTHMKLTTLTRELDDLCQQVQEGEIQPTHTLDHRVWTTETCYDNSYTNTSWTSQGSDTALYEHFVHCTKTNQSDNLLTPGYTCFSWTWCHMVRGLVDGYRNSSRFNKQKQS